MHFFVLLWVRASYNLRPLFARPSASAPILPDRHEPRMKFVIKLFPEITIKSKPVRQRLIRQLRQNISEVFKRDVERIGVQAQWDKIEVTLKEEQRELVDIVADTLQRIPGIANILLVQSYQIDDINNNFAQMAELCVRAFADTVRDKRFVVRIKRAGKHTFTSTDRKSTRLNSSHSQISYA